MERKKVGAPRKNDEDKMIKACVSISSDIWDKVDIMAKQSLKSKSAVLREAVDSLWRKRGLDISESEDWISD